MRKNIFKWISFFIVGIVGVSLFACGEKKPEAEKRETYLTRVATLAEGVDKVPTTNEFSKTSSPKVLKKQARAKALDGWTDISNPDTNAKYQDYIEWGRLTSDTEDTQLYNADHFVNEIKSTKTTALTEITQLGTWVCYNEYDKNITCYRLSYDALNDTAKIELVVRSYTELYGTEIEYTFIQAGYDGEGNSIVNAYKERYREGEYESCWFVDFKENQEWTVLYDFYQEDELDYICYARLSLEGKDMVRFDGNGVSRYKRLGNPDLYFTKRDTGDITTSYEYRFFNGNNELSANALLYPYFESEKMITFYFDCYELEGWNALYEQGNQCKIIIGEQEIGGETDTFLERERYMVRMGTMNIYNPEFFLQFNIRDKSLPYAEVVREFLSEIGLTLKDGDGQFDFLDKYETLPEEFPLMEGYNGGEKFDGEFFEERKEKILCDIYDFEKLLSFLNAPKIYLAEQVADENYYALFNAQLTGECTLNADTGVLNAEGITVSASFSALVETGAEYVLIIALCAPFETVILGESVAVWNEGDLSISNLKEYALTNAPVGEYEVKAFLAVKRAGGYTRVSKQFPLTASGEATLTTEENEVKIVTGETVTVTITPLPKEVE